MSTARSDYSILGIEPGASDEQIRKAYLKKSMQCHPDKFKNDPKKTEEFKELNSAYDRLCKNKFDINTGIYRFTEKPQSQLPEATKILDALQKMSFTALIRLAGKRSQLSENVLSTDTNYINNLEIELAYQLLNKMLLCWNMDPRFVVRFPSVLNDIEIKLDQRNLLLKVSLSTEWLNKLSKLYITCLAMPPSFMKELPIWMPSGFDKEKIAEYRKNFIKIAPSFLVPAGIAMLSGMPWLLYFGMLGEWGMLHYGNQWLAAYLIDWFLQNKFEAAITKLANQFEHLEASRDLIIAPLEEEWMEVMLPTTVKFNEATPVETMVRYRESMMSAPCSNPNAGSSPSPSR